MPHAETRQLRKHYRTNRLRKRAEKFARMRKRKEELRVERLTADPVTPDLSHCPVFLEKPSGFKITIECLEDGERVSFVAQRDPWGGLSVSPTLAGRKVAMVLKEYRPIRDSRSANGSFTNG